MVKQLKITAVFWNKFVTFMRIIEEPIALPLPQEIIAEFVAYLHDVPLKATTIRQHLSAIAYVHKMLELPDKTNTFFIKKLLNVCKLEDGPAQVRRPITYRILCTIIQAIDRVVELPYDKASYASLYSFMYAACLRVGEAILSGTDVQHVLQLSQIQFISLNDTLLGCRVQFLSYKNSEGKTLSILIEAKTDSLHCPVKLLVKFLAFRGRQKGYIFTDQKGKLVTATAAGKVLNKCLQFDGMNHKEFNMHSFRTGKCMDLALQGATEAQMRLAGRWESHAFTLYIKPDEIAL